MNAAVFVINISIDKKKSGKKIRLPAYLKMKKITTWMIIDSSIIFLKFSLEKSILSIIIFILVPLFFKKYFS